MCLSPITIKVNYPYVHSVKVPCGKCLSCLRAKQNSYMIRIYNQFIDTPLCYFVTLTYAPEHVPMIVDTDTGEFGLSVCKRHLQNAFKRFRIHNERASLNNKFLYFATSEYGPTTLRPHYHLLIFGLKYFELKPFLNDWENKYGFTNCKRVKLKDNGFERVSRYVSKYCSKGVFENPLVHRNLADKNFRLMSKGFGSGYIFRMRDFHLGNLNFDSKTKFSNDKSLLGYSREYISFVAHNRFVTIGDIRYSMPRYYKEKIFYHKLPDEVKDMCPECKAKSYTEKTNLQVALTRFILEELDRLYFDKLVEVQSSWNCSLGEAVRQVDLQDYGERLHKECRIRKTLNKYYLLSKV